MKDNTTVLQEDAECNTNRRLQNIHARTILNLIVSESFRRRTFLKAEWINTSKRNQMLFQMFWINDAIAFDNVCPQERLFANADHSRWNHKIRQSDAHMKRSVTDVFDTSITRKDHFREMNRTIHMDQVHMRLIF